MKPKGTCEHGNCLVLPGCQQNAPQYMHYVNFVMNRSPVQEEELAGLRI
jgi:hypothetical protein